MDNCKFGLREANASDVDILFEWVNDPIARKSAFSSSEITYEEHNRWFSRLLSSENEIQLILELDGEPMGQARVTFINDYAEIDYSIAPKFRLMGYGEVLISQVIDYLNNTYPEVKKIIARVKPENIASKRTLMKNGFEEIYSEYQLVLGGQYLDKKNGMFSIDIGKNGGDCLKTNSLTSFN